MAIVRQGTDGDRPAAAWAWLHQRETRQIIYQVLIVAVLVALAWMVISNTIHNLTKQNIASGFGFWNRTAGFDISQTLIEFSPTSTYGRAFWVGLCNTLLVAALGIVLATVVGFMMGIARLSPNWLIAKIAEVYIETVRNVPLLLQLIIWYKGVLSQLPSARESLQLPGGGVLNVRGLSLPAPLFQPGSWLMAVGLGAAVVATAVIARWARRRQMLTGQQFPVVWTGLGLIIGLPLIAAVASGFPVTFEYPELKGFNYQGGIVVLPELVALLLGLVIYTGSFIAEIVRSGIQGIGSGQKEAARALGLTNGQMLSLVVIPQALRIIIPPLTSQYLNLTKNSSLGIAIGYPELVGVFAGTVLNQTGQAVEVILITMLVYLTLSLLTSAFMNWFNARMKLVER